jgi:putative hydrolase of the HAD superfamily
MPSASDLDAVTIDAFGTLVQLRDPVPALTRTLAARGIDRGPDEVRRAFEAEGRYYVRHSLRGRDAGTLRALHRDCAAVFLAELGAEIDADEFAPAYVAALEFALIDGAAAALGRLAAAGLRLACVANWDLTLASVLERLGVADRFEVLAVSALVGAEKPDPAIFRYALDRIGASPERALHIGDSEADREGARATGLAFEPVPLATLPTRLGLDP